jgi:hypothetical protein
MDEFKPLLYGLLMLLPQSAAFHTLHARLAAVGPSRYCPPRHFHSYYFY